MFLTQLMFYVLLLMKVIHLFFITNKLTHGLGVICFPYGLILDKAFELLDRIEFVIRQNEEVDDALLNWERLAELSRRAQVHYRKIVELEAERRMAEVYKFSAAQRLQRIDSKIYIKIILNFLKFTYFTKNIKYKYKIIGKN